MKENATITIIDNINGEIRRHGMSQEKLCSLIGVSRDTYKGWQLRGELPATKLLKCARALGCSLDYLTRDVTIPENTSTLVSEV